MPVYFVYRCPYMGPTEKYVKRFEDDTVVGWFRRHWTPLPESLAWDHAREVLGAEVYAFGSVFAAIGEDDLPPPEDIDGVFREPLPRITLDSLPPEGAWLPPFRALRSLLDSRR